MKKMLLKSHHVYHFCRQSEVAFALMMHIIFGLLLCAVCIIFLLKMSDDILEKQALDFDTTIRTTVYAWRSPQLTSLMMNFTFLGSATFLVLGSALFMAYLFVKRKKDALIFFIIFYSTALLNTLLKLFFQRPRPDLMPLVHENSYSFPSGHAMNSSVFYIALSYFVWRHTRKWWLALLVSLLAALLIFCIGLSRVYLGAHYPSDVIAGYLTGVVWFTMMIALEKTIIFARLYKAAYKPIQKSKRK